MLERFDQYHGKKAEIRRLEVIEATQKEAFDGVKTGRFHDSVIYPYFEIPSEELRKSRAIRIESPGTTTWMLSMNTGTGKMADRRLRRCLAQSFDRKAFVTKFVPGHAPALGIMPPTLMGSGKIMPSASAESNCNGYEGVTVSLMYPEVLEQGVAMCGAFAEDFKKLGLNVKCEGMEFGHLLERIKEKKFDIAFVGQTLDLPDVEYFLEAFESNTTNNIANYQSPSVDRSLANARKEPDRAKRAAYFSQIDQELYENAATINISYPPMISYWNRCLEGVNLNMAGEAYVDYSAIRAKRACRLSVGGQRE